MRYLSVNQSRVRADVLGQLDHAAELLEAANVVRALGYNRLAAEIDRLMLLAFEQESDARHRLGAAGLDVSDL